MPGITGRFHFDYFEGLKMDSSTFSSPKSQQIGRILNFVVSLVVKTRDFSLGVTDSSTCKTKIR